MENQKRPEITIEKKPLPLVIDTMPGSGLRETYIDKRIRAGSDGERTSRIFTTYRGEQVEDLPY